MHRYRFPIAILALTVLTLALIITASPAPDAQAAPRSIPWNCDDWQTSPAVADAEDERVSVILESLAANRGKTIYCAIDQSDTFTKAETWAAGRHRNERDDTVYFGESGNFRGFLAAQEGYLTDGESGVTGVSRDLIFEFPREQRRGWKTIKKKLFVPEDDSRRLRSPFGPNGTPPLNNIPQAQGEAESAFNSNPPSGFSSAQSSATWQSLVDTAAAEYCREKGYPRVLSSISGTEYWEYSGNVNSNPNTYQYQARLARTWRATCEKKVRVRRR